MKSLSPQPLVIFTHYFSRQVQVARSPTLMPFILIVKTCTMFWWKYWDEVCKELTGTLVGGGQGVTEWCNNYKPQAKRYKISRQNFMNLGLNLLQTDILSSFVTCCSSCFTSFIDTHICTHTYTHICIYTYTRKQFLSCVNIYCDEHQIQKMKMMITTATLVSVNQQIMTIVKIYFKSWNIQWKM